MNIQEIMQNEKERLERSIKEKQELIAKLPNGTLQINATNNSFNWFVCNYENKNNPTVKNEAKAERNNKSSNPRKRKPTYISKHNRKLAEDLAIKGFLLAELRDETANLKATERYLHNCNNNERGIKYLSRNSEFRDLVQPYFKEFNDEVKMWLNNKNQDSVPHPENLKYMSKAGFYVRSKSEQLIVSKLVDAHLPFKYEQHMLVKLKDFYPDFMIMHPKTHKIYIWEHFGMMDDVQYVSRNLEKLKDYTSAGFYPSENLILTFETKETGIDELLIEKIIQHYFQ